MINLVEKNYYRIINIRNSKLYYWIKDFLIKRITERTLSSVNRNIRKCNFEYDYIIKLYQFFEDTKLPIDKHTFYFKMYNCIENIEYTSERLSMTIKYHNHKYIFIFYKNNTYDIVDYCGDDQININPHSDDYKLLTDKVLRTSIYKYIHAYMATSVFVAEEIKLIGGFV